MDARIASKWVFEVDLILPLTSIPRYVRYVFGVANKTGDPRDNDYSSHLAVTSAVCRIFLS